MSVVMLSQTDNGKSLELSRGQTLSNHLAENPTTGYRWAIDDPDGSAKEANAEVMILETTTYAPAPAAGVGGGGERTFIFRAASAGTARLQLKLWQPWEGEHSVVERYTLFVQVHG